MYRDLALPVNSKHFGYCQTGAADGWILLQRRDFPQQLIWVYGGSDVVPVEAVDVVNNVNVVNVEIA